jgi:hypothetical protein
VGARLTRLFLFPHYGLVPSIYPPGHIILVPARVDIFDCALVIRFADRAIMKSQTLAFVVLWLRRTGG